jgi:hypothetical protein
MRDAKTISAAVKRLEQSAKELIAIAREHLGGEHLWGVIDSDGRIYFRYSLLGQGGLGFGEASVRASEIVDFLIDPVRFYAAAHDVTRDQYLAWMEAGETWRGAAVQCAARLKAGRRCRGSAASAFTAKEWVALQGSYCAVHREGNKA